MNIKRWDRNKRAPMLAVALAATAMCNAVRAEDTAIKPTVAFIENAAQGRNIIREEYKSAIELLERSSAAGIYAFYAANNLCVAQLKVGDLTGARAACDKAVRSVVDVIDAPRRLQWHRLPFADRERFLAVALSNRGVVNAADGQEALARADFTAAIEADARCNEAKTNLAWLTQRSMSGA